MGPDLLASPPWPPDPVSTPDVTSRLEWYAGVASWAPSKHNTQPWRFVIRDRALEFWADPLRMLAETDPHRRELIISCGAAVQLACIAARAGGHRPLVSVLPDGVDGALARLVESGPWEPTEEDRELLAAVPRRRTDRGPLDRSPLPDGLPFLLQSAAAQEGASLRLVSTPGDRSTLADLVQRADRMLVQRGGIDVELARWLREPADPRADGVPSDHTRGAAASYRAGFVQRDFSTADSHPAQDRLGTDDPILGVLCTTSDSVAQWVTAGRALGALLLRAAAAGASASYLNQPIEEPAVRTQLRDQLELPGVAQLVLRLGAGGEVAPTPRRGSQEVIFRA